MGSSPVGPSSPPGSGDPRASAWGVKARSRSDTRTAVQEATQDAAQANSAANQQIATAQQAVQDAQNEANVSLEHIRDGFEQEESNQTEKSQEALEKQRLKGYEELRDLKQKQQAELGRVHREGERDLKQTTDYYRDSLYKNSRDNEDALRQQQATQSRQMQYIASTGQGDLELEKKDAAQKTQIQRDLHEHQLTELSQSNTKEYERQKTNSELARQQETQKFQSQFDSVVTTDRQALDNLQNTASQQIRDIRQDTTQKLAAYSSRQGDPFYKLLDIGAQLHDRGDSYVLTARIPTQEQRSVSASIRGNTLVISGTRRNEEHLNLAPGRTRGTSSYQSYEESFPLAWPVEKSALSKEFQGDRVIITVPKTGQESYEAIRDAGKRSEPERVRAERPNFPGNLPLPEDLSEDSSEEPGHKGHAGRVLT